MHQKFYTKNPKKQKTLQLYSEISKKTNCYFKIIKI